MRGTKKKKNTATTAPIQGMIHSWRTPDISCIDLRDCCGMSCVPNLLQVSQARNTHSQRNETAKPWQFGNWPNHSDIGYGEENSLHHSREETSFWHFLTCLIRYWPGLALGCDGPGGTPPMDMVSTLTPPKSCVVWGKARRCTPSRRREVEVAFFRRSRVCHCPSDSGTSDSVRSTFPATPASEMYCRLPFFSWEERRRKKHKQTK